MAVEQARDPALSPASTPAGAVFLSYASEDATAAERIAAALRAGGIEVWFDKSELRGGDAWDQSIRDQISACALFIPVISANAHARVEAYFRLEWKLAIDRSHRMAPKQPFLLPVVIDGTRRSDDTIPERFRDLQWTQLPGGEATPGFVARIRGLLTPEASTTRSLTGAAPTIRETVWSWRSVGVALGILAMLAAASAYLLVERPWMSKQPVPTPVTATAPAPAAPIAATPFAPPPHSIAVLPFVNMSGDKEQEYLSDGISEELLNDLARINELQVAARTSAFSFKGKDADIGTIARKLNVGAVLEGSVRRSAHTIRITAQLINAVTGFHMWSDTYDRDLGDVLKLQTEIAAAVAKTLKVRLLGDAMAKMEVGGTHNAAAFDAYLRASNTYWMMRGERDLQTAIATYTEAIRLDPNYALAYAARSIAVTGLLDYDSTTSAIRADLDKAQADARKAIALAPDLSEGHLALAICHVSVLEFTRAMEEYERAAALGPGNARVMRDYGSFAVEMGRGESGLTALHRALALDPQSPHAHVDLGDGLLLLKRYPEAIAAYKDAEALDLARPYFASPPMSIAYYFLGDYEGARSRCDKIKKDQGDREFCLAVTYQKLGRHADAESMLAKVRTIEGDRGAVDYSMIYAQWGNGPRALDWLETAMRLRAPDLVGVKASPMLDPLRNEPRFQAIERALHFPN